VIKVLSVPDCNNFAANVVEGRFLCDDPDWFSVGKVLFISVEQATTSLFGHDGLIPDFMSINSLINLTTTYKQVSIGFESSVAMTFIPLNLFIGQMLLHLPAFDSVNQTHISLLASKYFECTPTNSDHQHLHSTHWHQSPKGAVKESFPIQSRLASLGISLEEYEDYLQEQCEECYK
jgi:hypothetical protein